MKLKNLVLIGMIILISGNIIAQEASTTNPAFIDLTNIGTQVGPNLPEDYISVQGGVELSTLSEGAPETGEGRITKLTFTEEGGEVIIGGEKFTGIKPSTESKESFIELDENGEILHANFFVNEDGGSFTLGSKQIEFPAEDIGPDGWENPQIIYDKEDGILLADSTLMSEGINDIDVIKGFDDIDALPAGINEAVFLDSNGNELYMYSDTGEITAYNTEGYLNIFERKISDENFKISKITFENPSGDAVVLLKKPNQFSLDSKTIAHVSSDLPISLEFEEGFLESSGGEFYIREGSINRPGIVYDTKRNIPFTEFPIKDNLQIDANHLSFENEPQIFQIGSEEYFGTWNSPDENLRYELNIMDQGLKITRMTDITKNTFAYSQTVQSPSGVNSFYGGGIRF